METKQLRFEHRFFFPCKHCGAITDELNARADLTPLHFPQPVTESVYFCRDDQMCSLPGAWYVRIRRYIDCLTPRVHIESSSYFLELKHRHAPEKINRKYRWLVNGAVTTQLLMHPEVQPAGSILCCLPPLFPAFATQSNRYHWTNEAGGRITLDPEIFFFGFLRSQWQTGYRMGKLGQSKLEYKSSDPAIDPLHVLPAVLTSIQEQIPGQHHLERRIRTCHEQWIRNASRKNFPALK